jgi:formate dehydrogenase subunit gamma
MAIDRVWRALRGAALAGLLVAFPLPAQQPAQPPADSAAAAAQRQVTQPLNNAPVWREVRSGQPHFTTVRGVETDVLIQSSGETWRQAREPIAFWGAVLVGIAIVGLALFYLVRGTMRVGERPSGRLIRRFTPADRYAHWLLAITWVILAITGLVLSIGKTVLLPLIGYTLFSWLATLSKNLHNFVGPILIIAIPWMFVRYVRDNGISADDFRWFGRLFDYFRGNEYPSEKFNAGEKLVFWVLLVVLSTVLVVSGLVLNFPNFGQGRATMQLANTVHMITAYLAMAMAAVHIYLGTLGMTGALDAMKYGYVDEKWAQHHHARWYERVKAGTAREKFVEVPDEVPDEARRAVMRTT